MRSHRSRVVFVVIVGNHFDGLKDVSLIASRRQRLRRFVWWLMGSIGAALLSYGITTLLSKG